MKRLSLLPFHAAALLVAWSLKAFYSRAGADDLGWLLAPTCRLAGMLAGLHFEREAGAGWIDHAHRMIVGAGCSGMNFLIIAFVMFAFATLHRAAGPAARALCLAGSLAGAWLLTIAANTARVIVAIRLTSLEGHGSLLTPARLHLGAGVLVYCLSLLIAHLAVERLMDRFTRSAPARAAVPCLAPLGWYLAIALGLPVLDRAWRHDTGRFAEHAALVLALALVAAGAVTAARMAWRMAAEKRASHGVIESAPGRIPVEEP